MAKVETNTCVRDRGTTTWGANNLPLLAPPPDWRESWKWGTSEVQVCASDFKDHWPLYYKGDPKTLTWQPRLQLDYIIHKRPK